MADTADSADGDRLGHELSAAVIAFHEAIARWLGVNLAEQKALDELLTGGPATPSELADRLGLSRAAISKIVDRLEGQNYVYRRPSETDGRSVQLVLTRSLTDSITAVYDGLGSRMEVTVRSFDEAQLSAIQRWLTEMIDALREETGRLG